MLVDSCHTGNNTVKLAQIKCSLTTGQLQGGETLTQVELCDEVTTGRTAFQKGVSRIGTDSRKARFSNQTSVSARRCRTNNQNEKGLVEYHSPSCLAVHMYVVPKGSFQ
jgi:hypothetical protein